MATKAASAASSCPPRIIVVSTPPGATALTRTLLGAKERASPRVIETTPPLLAA